MLATFSKLRLRGGGAVRLHIESSLRGLRDDSARSLIGLNRLVLGARVLLPFREHDRS